VPRRSSKPPSGSAYDAGLRLIAGRGQSEWELKQKLLRRGYPEDEVAAAAARLMAAGYLGDAGFAREFVRIRSRSRGRLAITAELTARRVDRDLVDAALDRVAPYAEHLAALRMARRLAGNIEFASYRELLHSVGAKLLRRGFPMDLARAACRDVWGGTPEEAEA
jgi:regulatory protein